MEKRTVEIPGDVYGELENSLERLGFKSVDDYVTFVLRALVSGELDSCDARSEDEEQEIMRRLADLGYL
jgi:hypothetical protein